MNKIKITKYKKIATLVLLSLLLVACGNNLAASPTPIPLPAVGGSTNSDESTSSETDTTGQSSADQAEADQTEADQTDSSDTSSSTTTAEASAATTDTTSSSEENAPAESDDTSSDAATDTSTDTSTDIVPAQGITPEDASTPAQIDIERIRFSAPIAPMDWRIVRVGDQRTTEWIIPEDAAGWHPDSAGAGATGNLVLSGFQNQGSAVFSQLALGNVQEGQEITLTAADGSTHTYVVTEVGTPIPLDGTSTAERERVAQYYEPSEDARLTMVTGWPAFTTTHRLFIVAKLVDN